VRERRRRLLPARLMIYFTQTLWLFMGQGYDGVLRALVAGLRDIGPGWTWTGPLTASISKRVRLGPEVMRLLSGPVGGHDTPGVFWRVLGLDGTTLEVADPTDNDETFGRPSNAEGGGAYPQVRLVALAECGTRAVIDAVILPAPSCQAPGLMEGHQAWRNSDGGTAEVPGGATRTLDPDDVGSPSGPGGTFWRVPADW